ncbi:MAG: hypothetical protein NT154_41685 [Verrucomicrobia bacterium]|nr:hypothetical protein [Verrucomicrobiota bacterium]
MKRRTFIQMVGASALGLPFMYNQFKSNAWKTGAKLVPNPQCTALSLAFSPAEQGVISVLRPRSKAVCLLGGGVLTKASGQDLPYLNLLIDSAEFGTLKRELHAFGVQPISTPELPSHFIKFQHEGRPYSVLNMKLEAFLEQNVLGPRLKLLPLAHNFLVYSVTEKWVIDPYGALQSKARADLFRIRRLQDPQTPVGGLELCLAVAFDTSLLGLEAPVGHSAFEQRVLASTVGDEKLATAVFHQTLSFFPDLLELKGWGFTRRYVTSPLCIAAAAAVPRIDLKRVDASLQQVEKRGGEVSSSHLMLAINREIRNLEQTPGFGIGLPDYMAAKKLPIRRGDLMNEVLRGNPVALA